MTQHELIERQKWFVNLRLGQFIHFNSATQQFYKTSMNDWEDDHANKGAPRKYPFNPQDWNPSELDCAQWAKASKAMGARFAALTAKHHEGFCLWPTATTEHCVRNSTCKRDVVAEYLDAYRAQGIEAGLYFSMLDLTHAIGRHKCTPADVDFTKRQFEELLTNYGEIPFIIIDGWQALWGGPSYANMPFEEMDAYVKSIQPNCLLINHSCETTLAHTDVVFYENAAGQNAAEDFVGPGAAGNILTRHWFWREKDTKRRLKSAKWALEKITGMNAKNVAFLINASPNRFGLIDDNMVERFEEIGKRYHVPSDIKEIPAGWLTR